MARKLTKEAREAISVMEREGLQVVDWSGGGNTHYKLRVRAPDGRVSLIVASASPSDRQTPEVLRAQARAFIRGTL